MINKLLNCGHDVTIATRGKTADEYGDKVSRIIIERTNEASIKAALSGTHYDVVIDKIAYCSNDIKCNGSVELRQIHLYVKYRGL